MFQLLRIPYLLLIGLSLLTAACGGGVDADFAPKVTAVKALTLQYGKTATLQLGGRHMRLSMVVDTGGLCTNPSFSPASTTELMVFNCTVTATGSMPVTVRAANGDVIHQTTLTVPNPQVALSTTQGAITLELNPTEAPISVDNFLAYVQSGYYKDTLFHRVISGFVVQGGGFTAGMVKKEGQRAPIALESQNGLRNLRGTVAMARTDVPNSATSEFFVNLVDNAFLDYRGDNNPGYTVFGSVVSGLEVVDAIAAQATGSRNGFNDVPLTDIPILSALRVQ
jgi:peptidyl-prolyl cis-trans isomerase A (cyclophilin A)